MRSEMEGRRKRDQRDGFEGEEANTRSRHGRRHHTAPSYYLIRKMELLSRLAGEDRFVFEGRLNLRFLLLE